MTNEELVTFLKKNPIGIGCLVVSLALGAGIYFRGSALPKAEADLAEKTALADRLTTNITNATDLKEQLELLVAANKEIDTRIIRASQLPINYQFFYKLFADSGVKQIDLRWTPPGGVPKGKTFMPITWTVAVQGDLTQVLTFLRLVESGQRYARVLTAECTVPSNDRAGPVTLSLSLELLGLP